MTEFIYGRSGVGKSEEIFSRAERDAAQGKHVYILVPDRDAVSVERRASLFSGAASVDVVTFRRLCNYIFRARGGICESYISQGAKKVIMHSVLASLLPMLEEYGGVSRSDLSMTEALVSARSEMARNMISPETLFGATQHLSGKLRGKASDLSMIFSAFDETVGKRWRDPDGMISVACQRLDEGGFFDGCSVYVDGFTAFTTQQYEMIERIICSASKTCISVAYDPREDKNEPAFMTIDHTCECLLELAEKAGGEIKTDILSEPIRPKNEELRVLSGAFCGGEKATFEGETDRVKIICATNAYAEAEAVAVDIVKLVRSGMRWRDIAIVLRSTEEYSGIIDSVLGKYHVPYFISERVDISELALIKLVNSALSMCEHGIYTEDLISYIKTDLSGIEPEECSVFENYVIKWGINGKRFTNGDFLENPRGFGVEFTDADEKKLIRINEARKKIVEPLMRFSGVMHNAESVKMYATFLFDFLSSIGVPERLSREAKEAHDSGDLDREATVKSLWRAFCDALDLLVTSVGDEKCDISAFRVYLGAVLSETDIGRIPTSVDEVLIADAALTDTGGAKAVYIVGAYDGGFPKRVGEDGFFSEKEKSELMDAGVEISSRLWKKLSDELYFFYKALSGASEYLTVSYPRYSIDGAKQDCSIGIRRIKELFPNLSERIFEETKIEDLILDSDTAFEYAMRNDGLGYALREYYSDKEGYAQRLDFAKTPMTASRCALDEKNAKALFGNKMNTSYTKLEKYIKCRFSYFCEYELKLSDDTPERFGAVDVGSFIHKIMELAVKFTVNNPDATDAEIDAAIRKIADEYISFAVNGTVTKKLRHISDYLCRSARAFVDKIRAEMLLSRFRPMSFELTIGENGVKPLEISDGKTKVVLRGKVDRVDFCDFGDGELKIVVSDYKTGDKKFDIENVRIGLDTQMLLYLFSIMENGEEYYGKKISPAGIVYVGIKPPVLDISLESEALPEITKSGLFISDIEVLRAMDSELRGDIIPVKLSDVEKYNETKEAKKVISREALDELKQEITDTVLKYAKELGAGVAYANPISYGKDSPCKYCRFHAICRINSSKGEDK